MSGGKGLGKSRVKITAVFKGNVAWHYHSFIDPFLGILHNVRIAASSCSVISVHNCSPLLDLIAWPSVRQSVTIHPPVSA